MTFSAPETGQRTSQRMSPGDKRRFPRHICVSPGIEGSDLIEPNSVLVCWLAKPLVMCREEVGAVLRARPCKMAVAAGLSLLTPSQR